MKILSLLIITSPLMVVVSKVPFDFTLNCRFPLANTTPFISIEVVGYTRSEIINMKIICEYYYRDKMLNISEDIFTDVRVYRNTAFQAYLAPLSSDSYYLVSFEYVLNQKTLGEKKIKITPQFETTYNLDFTNNSAQELEFLTPTNRYYQGYHSDRALFRLKKRHSSGVLDLSWLTFESDYYPTYSSATITFFDVFTTPKPKTITWPLKIKNWGGGTYSFLFETGHILEETGFYDDDNGNQEILKFPKDSWPGVSFTIKLRNFFSYGNTINLIFLIDFSLKKIGACGTESDFCLNQSTAEDDIVFHQSYVYEV